MRIAQIAPINESVPPPKYGGTERIVSVLTEELVKRGHEVTLFASGDSKTSAKLVSTYPRALRLDFPEPTIKKSIWALRHVGVAYSMQEEFDIIHDHTAWLGITAANISATPVVMTLHGAFTKESENLFSLLRNPNLVSISYAQRTFAPHLNYIENVYNGLAMDAYPFSAKDEGYLLYVGRFCEEKSPHFAIEVAEKLGLPLIMAAKVEGKGGQEYFDTYIKPHLSKTIRWIGEVNEEERNKLYSKALCSLHPVSWPEPFGLTLIEAMSCGCPVVAFNKGAIPEVIKNGKTGFVVENTAEMGSAVRNIQKIKREACKTYARTTFSVEKMATNYEAVYERIIVRNHLKLKRQNQANLFYKRPFYAKEDTQRIRPYF